MKQTFRNPLLYKLKVYLKNNKEFGKEVGSWVEKVALSSYSLSDIRQVKNTSYETEASQSPWLQCMYVYVYISSLLSISNQNKMVLKTLLQKIANPLFPGKREIKLELSWKLCIH